MKTTATGNDEHAPASALLTPVFQFKDLNSEVNVKHPIVVSSLYAGSGSEGQMSPDEFANQAAMLPADTEVWVGQGMASADAANVKSVAISMGYDVKENFSSYEKARFTHKHREANILLRGPLGGNDLTDVYSLSVDPMSELVSDHTTGRHLQGMIGIEAGRQAAMNSFERRLLANSTAKYSFSLQEMTFSFHGWIFPVTAMLSCTLSINGRPDRWNYDAIVAIEQGGLVRWKGKYSIAVAPSAVLGRAERTAWDQLIRQLAERP